MKAPGENAVAIGGVGGSGTRLVAQIVDRLGFFIGHNLNHALDNLYFTLLFKRPLWFRRFPTDSEVSAAIRLFREAMTAGLSGQVTQEQEDYVMAIADQVESAGMWIGVDTAVAEEFLASMPPNFAKWIGWGWKEPNTHIFLPQLATEVEHLKYIHVIRNGLDIAFSKNQQQLKNWSPYVCERAFDRRRAVPPQSLNYWITANNRAIEMGTKHLGDRFLLLNCDHLFRSPREGVQVVADFLEVGVSRDAADDLAALVAPNSTGRWQQHGIEMFSDTQLEAVRKLGFDTFAEIERSKIQQEYPV